MNKHTIGPWASRPNPDKDGKHSHWIDAPNGIPLAEVRQYHNGRDNARLIAAAPEMLAALVDLVEEFGHQRFNVRKDFAKMVRIEAARKAIAKAKGEQ